MITKIKQSIISNGVINNNVFIDNLIQYYVK